VSRRPDGRRGRRKPDPAEETASWLLEVERAGQQADEEEDDWSGTLRATRREATGQFPPVPSEGSSGAIPSTGAAATPPAGRPRPPAAEPPAGRQEAWFNSERSGQAARHDTGSWGGSPAQPWRGSDPGAESPAAWRQAETSGVAEPLPQEPPAWESQADAAPWNGRWPFEEVSQSWEPDDRSYTWPAQELPANTGSWENQPAPAPSEDPWASPRRGGHAGPPGYEGAGYQAPAPPAGGYSDPAYGNSDPAYGNSDAGYGGDAGYIKDPGYTNDPGYGGDPGYAADPGGYAAPSGYAPGGYEQAADAYPPPAGYPQTGSYPAAGGYETAAGQEASNGYQASNGYDGSGQYPPTGDYSVGGYASSGDYPSTGGDPNTSGEYTAGDPYATGPDPYATGDQYPASDPYAGGAGDAAAREPYPGHDPFAAYGLQGSRRQYGAGDGAQAVPGSAGASQTGFDTGQGGGPVGAGHATGEIWPPVSPAAAGAAAPPPRPETWPAQTGTWGIEEPPPSPRSASTGEFSRVLESDEQVVRLGRGMDGDDGPLDPGPRVHGGRGNRAGEARLLEDGDHVSHRARWPRVVALISWIILLMVLCWFYVFPWLEKILPENF